MSLSHLCFVEWKRLTCDVINHSQTDGQHFWLKVWVYFVFARISIVNLSFCLSVWLYWMLSIVLLCSASCICEMRRIFATSEIENMLFSSLRSVNKRNKSSQSSIQAHFYSHSFIHSFEWLFYLYRCCQSYVTSNAYWNNARLWASLNCTPPRRLFLFFK